MAIRVRELVDIKMKLMWEKEEQNRLVSEIQIMDKMLIQQQELLIKQREEVKAPDDDSLRQQSVLKGDKAKSEIPDKGNKMDDKSKMADLQPVGQGQGPVLVNPWHSSILPPGAMGESLGGRLGEGVNEYLHQKLMEAEAEWLRKEQDIEHYVQLQIQKQATTGGCGASCKVGCRPAGTG